MKKIQNKKCAPELDSEAHFLSISRIEVKRVDPSVFRTEATQRRSDQSRYAPFSKNQGKK
jgi:hypothetical protein